MLDQPTKNAKVLYVDDEVGNLTAFKAVFRRNYDVITASSGQEALNILNSTTCSMVISDQRMPGMTGVELFSRLKDTYPDTIRIILTGYTDMNGIIDSINMGNIYYYITKPWKTEELRVVMDNAIETYNLRITNRELKEENILAQYTILKNQINPHFLFNCMNILNALIPESPKRAVVFTSKFSKLYRSLLELQNQQVIDLNDELDFVRNYIFLQKERFDDALIFEENNFTTEVLSKGIPPFSLQMIIENAIKHNILSAEHPLRISVVASSNEIEIRNNLQLRKNVVDTTGIGLRNIMSRYQLLGSTRKPSFNVIDNTYIATLPLI